MKRIVNIFLFIICSLQAFTQINKDEIPKKINIAIFSSLYIENVKTPDTLKKEFPSLATAGLDFLLGAKFALNELNTDSNTQINLKIFDLKNNKKSLNNIIENDSLKNYDIVIAYAKDQDCKVLSTFCNNNKIAFVSAVSANDYGITNQPYTYILNSTIKTTIQTIYSRLAFANKNDKIFLVSKQGKNEDFILSQFNKLNDKTDSLKLKFNILKIDSLFNLDEKYIGSNLDLSKKNVFVAASLDEIFAEKLALAVAKQKINATSPMISLYGMPNWDLIYNFYTNKTIMDSYIYIPTPFFIDNAKNNTARNLYDHFEDSYNQENTSSFAIRGYDAISKFIPLLLKFGKDNYLKHINDFTDKTILKYNITPVYNELNKTQIDYYENNHFYFVKMYDGKLSNAWETK